MAASTRMAALTKNATVKADDGINGIEPDGAANGGFVLLELPALHQGRVQIEVVRHDRRPDDADGNVDHPGCRKLGMKQRPAHFQKFGLRLRQDKNFDEITNPNGRHQQQHDRLNRPHAKPLQREQQAKHPVL